MTAIDPPDASPLEVGPSASRRAIDDTEVEAFLRGAHIFATTVKKVLEERFLADVCDEKLSFPHFNVLKLLSRRAVCHVGDIAQFLSVSYPAASKIVERLYRMDLITRAEDPNDRRAACLDLAPDGVALIERYEQHKKEATRALLADLPDEAIRQLGPTLERLASEMIGRSGGAVNVCMTCGAYYPGACTLEQGVNCVYTPESIAPGSCKSS